MAETFSGTLSAEQAAAFRSELTFERLAPKHGKAAREFECQERVDDFLQNRALEFAAKGRAVTWVFLHGSTIVGFISLSTGLVTMGTEERQSHDLGDRPHQWPAMLVGWLGVDRRYRRRGLGRMLLKFAIGNAANLRSSVGCRFVTADVYQDAAAIAMYTDMGFEPVTHPDYKKRSEPPYFYDLLTNPPVEELD